MSIWCKLALVQVRTECSLGQLHVYVCTESSRNPTSATLEPDLSQQDCPATYVIVQQYCSTTFVSFFFLSYKEKFRAHFRNVVPIFSCFFKNVVSLKFHNLKLCKLSFCIFKLRISQ